MVLLGGSILMVLVALAVLAPWLGTVDPAAMDSNFINKAAGLKGDFTLVDGSTVAHIDQVFHLGKSSMGSGALVVGRRWKPTRFHIGQRGF
jgi:peptide/nickel transport system permease protein